MKIVKHKIIEGTESELMHYYLSRGYDDIYSFPEFIRRMQELGVEVLPDED